MKQINASSISEKLERVFSKPINTKSLTFLKETQTKNEHRIVYDFESFSALVYHNLSTYQQPHKCFHEYLFNCLSS